MLKSLLTTSTHLLTSSFFYIFLLVLTLATQYKLNFVEEMTQ